MDVRLHVLDADPALAPHRDAIEEAASSAVAAVGQRLPAGGVDVVVQRNAFATIPELGIGGFSPSGHLVHVSLDLMHERFDEVSSVHLSRTLAHELHHCARWRGPGYGRTLGEALVSEGLADHFDLEVHPGARPYFWTQALSEAELREVWERARPCLWDESYDHATWFFNQAPDWSPFHAGYGLGFHLVGAYLKAHPDRLASTLAQIPARVILRDDDPWT